jgi:tRNA (guanine-N7-)-methyltransferase
MTAEIPEVQARQPVRSFVLRAGRITRAQRRALQELLPRWGLPYSPAALDLDAVFGRRARRVMEIGFGDGGNLLELAASSPETDFIGVEVHAPGVGRCLLGIESGAIANIRVIAHDAVEVLETQFGAGSLDEVLLYFPDPWPKKRHHKRRIVKPAFVSMVADRLKPGGAFRLATDWEPYAEWMVAAIASEPRLANAAPDRTYIEASQRAATKFEARGRRLGHRVFDLCFERI